MTHLTRIGIDLAKQVFQLHGVDERGHTVLRRRVSRSQVRAVVAQLTARLVSLEACDSAHYWAREMRALGHDVRPIAPQFVTPYRTKDTTDGHDAEAIGEAVGRHHLRFVPVKDVGPQAALTVHRAQQLLVAERTALVNHSRGLLAEYGLIVPAGIGALRRLWPSLLEAPEMPALAREVFTDLADRLRTVDERIAVYDRRVEAVARQGLTPQKPLQRAYQRDPDAIARWQRETYPALARHAKRTKAEISFWDESGFRADAVHGKTWGVRTHTPVVHVPGQRQSISAASAVNSNGAFWFATYAGALTGPLFIDLLRRMMRGRRKPLHLILDGLPAHKALAVKEYVAGLDGKLTLHYLPGYAPDLNPDELVWSHAKRTGNARRPLQKGERLANRITAQLAEMARRPALVRSFFRHPRVAYITAC